MGSETKIQWATHTFNPWRNRGESRVVASEAMWRQPIKWNRDASFVVDLGEPRPRVFCASLADVFEDWPGSVIRGQSELTICHGCGKFGSLSEVIDCGGSADLCGRMPRKATLDDVRARLFRTIDATRDLIWLLLTKRIENARRMWQPYGPNAADGEMDEWRSNVWLGVSIACQDDADRLIPELLKCRDLCAKTFLSIEPILDDIDIRKWLTWELDVDESQSPGHFTRRTTGIDWIVAGGESGPKARPCHVEWIRSIVKQCKTAGVPVFVKQLGSQPVVRDAIGDYEAPGSIQNFVSDLGLLDKKGGDPAEWPEGLRVREVPS